MSSYQRRVGLSRTKPTTSLLKQLPGTATATKSTTKLKVPASFDAPPLSTDDENEISDDAVSPPSAKPSADPILDSSEDEGPARGDIKSTAFQPLKETDANASTSTSKSGRPSRQLRTQKQTKQVSKGPAKTTSSKKRKASEDIDDDKSPSQPISGAIDPHRTEHGFTKKTSIKATYKPKKGSEARSTTKLKTISTQAHDSPQRVSRFIRPPSSPLSSPTQSTKRLLQSFGDDDVSEDSSTSRNNRTIKKPSNAARTPKGKVNIFIPKKKRSAKVEPESATEVSPILPARKLVIPTPLSQFEASTSNVPRSGIDGDDSSDTLSDAPSDLDMSPMQDLFEPELKKASCPWCGASVDKSLLEDFSKGKRLNVRMQSRFCRSHKKATALETWKERKYPQVEWEELEERFSKHRNHLLGIIDGEDSHFRSILAAKIESGRARSMKKEDNLNPGYFGSRGFNIMCDWLVGEFGDMLREKAASDKVIAGRGSAAFIQSVLVADLAVRLIEEDMGVSTERAREILEESKALGDIVHEER